MALKQVVDTTKNTYLTKRFEDDEGNQYGDAAAKSLVAWYRFTASAPTNLSTNKFYDDASTPALIDVGATYGASAAAPALSTSKIGEIFYNTATFGADATDQVNIGTAVEWDHIIGNEVRAPSANQKPGGSTQKMTFSAWIYKTGDGGNSSGRIFDFGKDIILLTDSDDKVRFYVTLNGSHAEWRTASNAFSLNTWTHVAVSYDASASLTSDPKIYVNGKLVDVTLENGSRHGTYSGITTEACFIGNNSDLNRAFAGSIAEACVWNQTLTSENIKATYNASQVRFTRNQTVSGFLNHSPRIQSIENINYHEVHGKFDDTRTIDFIEPRQTAVLKIKKRPYDAKVITITDPHNAPGDSASSASKTFEFQLGVIKGAANIEINIKDAKTPAQVARKIVSAINSNTASGAWSFTAQQTKPNEVTITRGKIDAAGACTVTTNAGERFIEIVKQFKANPQPTSVYPSLEISDSVHLLERKNYGGSTRSDIEIVRPVSRITPLKPKAVHVTSPFNEAHAHAAFGFIEGIEGVSPERDLDSTFYVSGSASAIGPESVGSRKKIVIDMPVAGDTVLHHYGAQLSSDGIDDLSGFERDSRNHPMAYYNFGSNKWERTGISSGSRSSNGSAGSAQERADGFRGILDRTMIGFTPSSALTAWRVADRSGLEPNESVGFQKGSGAGNFFLSPAGSLSFANGATNHPRVISVGSLASPTNVFGFPAHPKFHATGSQELTMSKYIKKPFVLEKIVYEFNVGMNTDFPMKTLSADLGVESVEVDFPTVTFFILNQREAAIGSELASVPTFRMGDGVAYKSKLEEAISFTNPICPPGKEIPTSIQLSYKVDTFTGKQIPIASVENGKTYKIVALSDGGSAGNWNAIGADSSPAVGEVFTANSTTPTGTGIVIKLDGKDVEVSTIRDLVTWSRLTCSPSGFNSGYLDATAKDVRKDSDLVLTPDDNNFPFGKARKISYTAQPADGATVTLVSTDGTKKIYEFDTTVTNGNAIGSNVGIRIGNDADATYANLATAVRSASGHNGKIIVVHTDNHNSSGDIVFYMGPKKYSVAGECIAPVVQISSGSIPVGAPALMNFGAGYTIADNPSGGLVTPFNITSANAIEHANGPQGQVIALSKNSTGRTLVGIQSGRSIAGENPSSKALYTFRGLKNADVKITAYEKDHAASPYVLLPTDKLIIGCQAPVGAYLDSDYDATAMPNTNYIHPSILLGRGDGRIILYGYELEKEAPSFRDYSKDSTGSSEFLSEKIGDIATRDEFETHPRMTYYRSSIDEVVTGSMLPRVVGNDFNTQTQAFARKVVGRNSQGTQGGAGSLLRARKLQDRSERYYDSMAPDIRDLMSADSVNTLDIGDVAAAGIILGVGGSDSAYKSFVGTGVDASTKVIWDNWFSSYPFEPRYANAARLAGVRKDIPTKVQTGANKGTVRKKSVDHVSLALFESTGTLGVTGMVGGVYTTSGILDNPEENENTNRLVPLGRSSGMFINSPPINAAEVYASWAAQSNAATGSIEVLTALDTEEEAKSLHMKTLTIDALPSGASTTVSEKFVFTFQDSFTEADYAAGQTKVSVTPPVLKVSYSELPSVSDFHDMMIQIPTTGSMATSSGLKLFLDSGGNDLTGDAVSSALLDNNSRTNKGFLSVIGSGNVLNDMWVTGSVVQIDKVLSENGVNTVNTSGTVITAGGVATNNPMILFNDKGGNEAQRFIQLDRLVNSYDKDDINRKSIGAGGGLSAIAAPDSVMELKFKHIKAVNTSVHPTLNEPPDSDEDLVVELSVGVAATTTITIPDGDEAGAAGMPSEKQAITIQSTDGTVKKYVIVDTSTGSGHAAANSVLTANSVTGAGTAGSSNIGGIAVQVNRGTDTQNAFLVSLRNAIVHSNGHNGKIVVSTGATDSNNDGVPDQLHGSQFITLTQSKRGLSGNTNVTSNLTNVTTSNFTGGACLDHDASSRLPESATWGKTIDHSSMSRSDGFIENNFKLGQSLRYIIGTPGGVGFGQDNDDRVRTQVTSNNADTQYNSTTKDVIRFGLRYVNANGGTSDVYYQFFPVSSDAFTHDATFTYASDDEANEDRLITAAAGNTNQQLTNTPSDGNADFTYFYRVHKNLSGNTTDSTFTADQQLVNARLLAQAINAASELQDDTGSHVQGSFAAVPSQDDSNTYINIYLTSFAQAAAALSPPTFIDVDGSFKDGNSITAAGSNTFVGAGAADDVFVSIRQTSATVADAYGIVDIELKADLDPAGAFLTYDATETGSKKASVVNVDISNATNVDEVYAEIANAVNITTTQSTTAIRPMENILVATHVSGSNTLSFTYNMPTRQNDFSGFANKVLLPLPGARYDITNLKPAESDLTHRVIPISDWTNGSTADDKRNNAPAKLAGHINTALLAAKTANSADSISWNPTVAVDAKVVSLTQEGKGSAGNVAIATTASNTLITTRGFVDGSTAVYGDGDSTAEPLDADPESFSSATLTVNSAGISSWTNPTLGFGSQNTDKIEITVDDFTLSTKASLGNSNSSTGFSMGNLASGVTLMVDTTSHAFTVGDKIEISRTYSSYTNAIVTLTAHATSTTQAVGSTVSMSFAITDGSNPLSDSDIVSNIITAITGLAPNHGFSGILNLTGQNKPGGGVYGPGILIQGSSTITWAKATTSNDSPVTLTTGGASGTTPIPDEIASNIATNIESSISAAIAAHAHGNTLMQVSRSNNVVTFSAKNRMHIKSTTPVFAIGGDPAAYITPGGWTGADLVKITGALLKRSTVQQGVFENDPEDVDTVKFASVVAKDVAGEVRSDSSDRIYELGSFLKRTETDYFSKVFFGTGDGPAKSPKHKITEKANLILATQSTLYEVVTHNGAAASAVDTSNFTLTGVAARQITNKGTGPSFQDNDTLLGFTGAGTRRMDLSVEIQAGETVEIRYAAASFWYGSSGTGGTVPQVITAEGIAAEKADNGDNGVHVKVSVDGGTSYSDVHDVFGAKIDNASVSSSSLFSGNSSHPIKSAKFDDGDNKTLNDHKDLTNNLFTNVGSGYYPVFKFTATSNCKLRLEQPVWSSQSVSFDHWWFRFLVINVSPPPGEGSGSVAVSGRGNFNQTASATGIEIRGAKYGLISPVKLNTSAIFRAGSFGQVRDMLEQRPLTRTFDGQRVSESPVAVSFQERQTKRPISPEETNSANLDIFCTSSLPYFDGLAKDRASDQPDLVDEIDVDITV